MPELKAVKAAGPYSSPEEGLREFREGRMLIVVDTTGDGHGADLIVSAEHAGADEINFMAKEARGLICLALSAERCDELGLEPMVPRRSSHRDVDYTISVEAASGVSTGISAADRARTVAVAIDPASRPADLVSPGHVFPLRAKRGGLLERPRHTEAAVDIARLADGSESAVVCQMLAEDGAAARTDDLIAFARKHGLKMVLISDLIEHVTRTKAAESNPEAGEAEEDGQRKALRGILGKFVTGVTVVTTTDDEGGAFGTTANAFTSVSLDPPLILICLARESVTLELIKKRGAFVANILADSQQQHSDRFARRGMRLDPAEHDFSSGFLGVPILAGTVAHIECSLERVDPGGDHEILLGRVVSFDHHAEEPDPLLYFRGGYRRLDGA